MSPLVVKQVLPLLEIVKDYLVCDRTQETGLIFFYLVNLLHRSPIPVIVTEFKKDDDEEGLPEKTLIRNNTFYE